MADNDTVEVKTRLKRRRVLKMAYNRSQTDGRRVATIRCSGAYLEDLGFRHDGYFELVINDDRSITIRPCEGGGSDVEEAGENES